MANLSAGLVLLRQQPGTPSPNNNSFSPVTELGITENELEQHKMMKVDHGIVEADLGPADPGPVLLPEPTNTEHMISLVPVISCILITFGYACGLGPVPFILFGELFPNSVRGPASSITAFLRSITVFLSIKIFPSLLWLFDIGGSFISCAVVCAFAIGDRASTGSLMEKHPAHLHFLTKTLPKGAHAPRNHQRPQTATELVAGQ